jgi:hypothetical protein
MQKLVTLVVLLVHLPLRLCKNKNLLPMNAFIGIPMNDWDKDNLNFLLTIDSKTFEDWLEQADEDDIDYAIELLRAAKSELIVEQMEILDGVQDISTANNFIEQIRKTL